MNTALRRVLRAAHWGMGLAMAAGCSSNDDPEGGTQAGVGDGAAGSTAMEAYPVPDACEIGAAPGETCDSEVDFTCGPCCTRVACIDVDADSGACPAASDALKLPGGPVGSGTCDCKGMTGPFAPRLASEGPCCYSFGIIDCVGRPFLAHGVARVAGITRRADWT